MRTPSAAALAVAAAVALALAGAPARAELLEVRQIAKGMECAECARNLKLEIGKLDGVEAATASWNRRVLTVRFARGAKTTLADIRAALRRQHFVPGEAEIVVTGRLVRSTAGGPVLDGGAGGRYRLDLGAISPAAGAGAAGTADAEVLVTGRVPGEPQESVRASADRNALAPLFVVSLKAARGDVDSGLEIPRGNP